MQTQSKQFEEIYAGLPEEVRVMANAAHTFSEALAIHTRVMEAVADNTKVVKDYFTEARGGFIEDLDKKNAIVMAAIRENNQAIVGAIERSYQLLIEKSSAENAKMIKAFEVGCTDKIDTLEKSFNLRLIEMGRDVAAKIALLIVGASSLVGLIVYLIEKSVLASYIAASAVK
jgi:hypothetical protein